MQTVAECRFLPRRTSQILAFSREPRPIRWIPRAENATQIVPRIACGGSMYILIRYLTRILVL